MLVRMAETAVRQGAWEWEVATDSLIWSSGLYRIAGRDPKLGAPRQAEQARLYSPESWQRLERAVRTTLATGLPFKVFLELIRPDGSRRCVVSRGLAVKDAFGRVSRIQALDQDITDDY